MPDVDDIALLREYADRNSESAFAEIVHRHINLVYSVALRFTGNCADAQDVTQAVFVILSKKAAGLRPKTILTGWLYETTRFAAMNYLTGKTRRQAREQEACMHSTLDRPGTESAWKQLAPVLEEGMSRLNEKDRTVLALRYFENKTHAETAAILGMEESAAGRRANRAVEKLRRFFTRRGIILPAAALMAAISANSVQAAPVALAATVAATAAKGTSIPAAITTLVKGTMKKMTWLKYKFAAGICLAAILIGGAATVAISQTGGGGAATASPQEIPSNIAPVQQTGANDVSSVIVQSAQYFSNLHSVEYTVLQGDEKGKYFSKAHWKEMGDKYWINYENVNKDNNSDFKLLRAYDGDHGYDYRSGEDVMLIQKARFGNDRLIPELIFPGPFRPFQFLLQSDTRPGVDAMTAEAAINPLLKGRAFIPKITKPAWSSVHSCKDYQRLRLE